MKLTPNIKVFIPGNLYPGSVKCKIINKDKDLILKRNTTRNCFCCVCVYCTPASLFHWCVPYCTCIDSTCMYLMLNQHWFQAPYMCTCVYTCVHSCTGSSCTSTHVVHVVQYQYTKERKCMCVDIHVVYICMYVYTYIPGTYM